MKKNNLLKFYKNKALFSKVDTIILLLVVISIIISIIFITNTTKGDRVEIYYKGELIENCSLDIDKTIIVEKNGYNKIVINNKKVYVEEANCANQLCVKSKPISMVNQRIICSPNGIVVIIKGNDDIDAITGGGDEQ